MKLTSVVQEKAINHVLKGICPICKSKNNLINVGTTFKPSFACRFCGAKFEQRSLGSSKYKLIESNSKYLDKEFTLSEWNLIGMSKDNIQTIDSHHVLIVSEYSTDITKDRVNAILKGFDFEVFKKEKEYFAHKGNWLVGFILGFWKPECEIFYSISEKDENAVVDISTSISYWKGGGALGMAKQESIFKEIVAAISNDLTTVIEKIGPIDKTTIAGDTSTSFEDKVTTSTSVDAQADATSEFKTGKSTLSRTIVAGFCILFGLFILFVGIAGFVTGIGNSNPPEMLAGMLISASGIVFSWFGWRHRIQIEGDTGFRYLGALGIMAIGILIIFSSLIGMSDDFSNQSNTFFSMVGVVVGIFITWMAYSRRKLKNY